MRRMLEIEKMEVRPIRIIPFDIGYSFTRNKMDLVIQFLDSKYERIELSLRLDTILSKNTIGYKIDINLDLFIFQTGIGVFSVRDKTKIIESNIKHFSIEYCQTRRDEHNKFLNWKHDYSPQMQAIIAELREKFQAEFKKRSIRKTSSNNFEYGGISYVMTLSLFNVLQPKKEIFDWNNYPGWLKNNISILLEPSIVFMEDSLKFNQSQTVVNHELNDILINLDEEPEYHDYEKRKHISTFMSWAAVVVIGKLEDPDIEEYIALEVELQHKWFYIYCLEKNLPSEVSDLLKSKIDIIKLRNLSYEMELYEEKFNFIDDSSVPERLQIVQKGLIETSGILGILQRYKRTLHFFEETLMFEGQMRQKKYGKTSEMLLYFIAYVQMAPILYGLLKGYIRNTNIDKGILLIMFVFGCMVLFLKNRER